MWDERTRAAANELAASVVAARRPRASWPAGPVPWTCWAAWPRGSAPTGCGPRPRRCCSNPAGWRARIGQRTWEAQALVAAAMGFYFALCRNEQALATLDEVLAQLPARSTYRALVQSFRSDVLIELGRFAEAEGGIDEMREMGTAYREEWMIAYAAWSEAAIASYSGDRARTVRAVHGRRGAPRRLVRPGLGGGVPRPCQRLPRPGGRARMALERLARAQAADGRLRAPGARCSARPSLGRSGDPEEAARIIAATLAEYDLEPQERWPLLLLRAYAAIPPRRPGRGQAGRGGVRRVPGTRAPARAAVARAERGADAVAARRGRGVTFGARARRRTRRRCP